jgi:cell division protein FtsW
VGLSLSLVLQAMINMAVAVNLVPVTGQPLPLVSMGGTSIWFTCLMIGIVLSVSRSVYDEVQEDVQPKPRTATAAA